jgi:uncharacterized protein
MSDDVQPAPAAPVAEASRLKMIDALRGVALLGILLMNIPGFSMPNYFSEAFKNDPGSVNFWLDAFIAVVFEGKMRALFGMVFGAGVLLFVSKKEKTGKSVTGLFYRRMLWLVLFGLIHAHLILWIGDILYLYGLCGMIVYLARNVNPKILALGVPLVAVVDFGTGTLFYTFVRQARIAYVDAVKAQAENKPLTDAQKKGMEEWRVIEKTMIPNRDDAKENTKKMKSDYATVAAYLRPISLKGQTLYVPFMLADSLALMFLGLALYRWGFLTGGWTKTQYVITLVIGYGLGFPLAAYAHHHHAVTRPSLEASLAVMEVTPVEWVNLIYPFQRILIVLAHVAALVLLYRAGIASGLFRRLEAVGQMAFTNYVMHSVICTLFFFGYGLNYYAELDFYQIYFVAVAIWVMQLIVSPLWLKYFLFGPVEWLWRSLTYWKVQPMRRVSVD